MNVEEKHELRIDQNKAQMPRLGGTLTAGQREEIGLWTHVPPFDGFTLQLDGTGGVMGGNHQQLLMGFRGILLSEMISLEYLLAAVPLADKLKDEEDFSLKFWKETNKNRQMFGCRLKALRSWIDGQFLQTTPANFDAATGLLLDVRNSLTRYPVQGAYEGTKNTLTPFVYRASKDQLFLFDDHKINVFGAFCSMVKGELQAHFNKLNHARIYSRT